MPSPLDPAREITLRLEAMTYGGEALGRLGGKAIFVSGGLPGEQVRIAVEDDRTRFARARVIEVIEPSPDRIAPRCPHFGFDSTACGGCHWQHIDYAAQLRFKTAIVREQLQRLGHVLEPPVRDTLPSPAIWHYRNHAQFHLTREGQPGFQAARSHRVVPLEECPVIEPVLEDWLKSNRHSVKRASRASVRSGHSSDRTSGATRFQLKDATLRVSDESFFQVNTSLIEGLIDQVVMKLDPQPHETIVDAYCGVGLFSRFLTARAGRIVGIESSASAVHDFRMNLAGFDQVEVRHGPVEKVLPQLDIPIAAAVFDPPRAGCGARVIEAIVAQRIDRVVYVSCDPATLARDVRQLIDSGYALIEVQPLDLFPHTYHIETITLLRRANRAIL
ncbi:23S rRNA (uracil(1939)-C(5))-methyltransferase RlmD [Thermoflexales bacterium]|nr:23S rRNA (uracil(1939)-C(5))-methyltransferase RlmD [Thermoflexales bacterium]